MNYFNLNKTSVKNYDPDFIFKLILVGNSGIGKSSLLLKFCCDNFNDNYTSTIGVDFKVNTIELNNKIIKLQIWDTAGQERFRSVISSYYRGAHGIFIMFDLTNIQSFNDIKIWINETNKYANSKIIKLFVGTKSDLKQQIVVTPDMIDQLCLDYDALYMETSSRANINVDNVFNMISQEIMKEHEVKQLSNNQLLSGDFEKKTLLSKNIIPMMTLGTIDEETDEDAHEIGYNFGINLGKLKKLNKHKCCPN
jgi:Ras-related protein Rab-1A